MVEHHLVKVSDESSILFFPAHERTRVAHFTPLEEQFMGQNTWYLYLAPLVER